VRFDGTRPGARSDVMDTGVRRREAAEPARTAESRVGVEAEASRTRLPKVFVTRVTATAQGTDAASQEAASGSRMFRQA